MTQLMHFNDRVRPFYPNLLLRHTQPSMKPLVFIHIPKAGGKSFEKLLLLNYPDPRKVIRIYRTTKQELGEVFTKVPRQKIEHFDLMYGHIPCRIEKYTGRPCDYITMLREPVERFLSFYRYVKYDFPSHPLHARLNSGELNLLNLINKRNNNRMTKMLAGIDVNEPPPPSMFEDAKRNLKMMPVFGLLERSVGAD